MINWLKKLWNLLKSLFNGSSEAIETDNTPSQPRLSDAEYESVLFALLAAIKKGRSWGSCQGFLISRNIQPDELAEWIENKSLEWLENADKYQQLGQDLEELGNLASGQLGNLATKVSSELGVRSQDFGNFQENNLNKTESNPTPSETQNTTPSQTKTDEGQKLIDQSGEQYQRVEDHETVNSQLENCEQQLSLILEDREYNTYLTWTNELREEKIQQLQTLINQPQQSNENKSELYREMGRLYAASKDLDQKLECYETAIKLNSNNAKAWNPHSALRFVT